MITLQIRNSRNSEVIEKIYVTSRLIDHFDSFTYRSIMDLIRLHGDNGVKIEISVSPRIIQTKLNF